MSAVVVTVSDLGTVSFAENRPVIRHDSIPTVRRFFSPEHGSRVSAQRTRPSGNAPAFPFDQVDTLPLANMATNGSSGYNVSERTDHRRLDDANRTYESFSFIRSAPSRRLLRRLGSASGGAAAPNDTECGALAAAPAPPARGN